MEQFLFRLANIDLLTEAVHEIIPVIEEGGRFVPSRIAFELTELSGVIGVTPIVRCGNNGTNDNLMALTTLTSLTAENKLQQGNIILTDTIDLSEDPINFEVQTAGGTATVLKANVYLVGYLR